MQTADSVKVKAIAVRAVPYGESDMIITLVGVETGKITATAKGCLKRGAKLRYAAEPFNFGDYVLAGRGGRYVVTECEQIESFGAITADIERYYDGCLILDALAKLSEQPAPEEFMAALNALSRLAYSNEDPDAVIRDFLLTAIEIGGNRLDFAHCNACGRALEGAARFQDADGIVCESCANFGSIEVEAPLRAFLAGESGQTHAIGLRANILLLEFVHIMLGVKISARYLTEQL